MLSPLCRFRDWGMTSCFQLPTLHSATLVIPVSLTFVREQFRFPDLVNATQWQIDREIKQLTDELFKVILVDNLDGSAGKEEYNLNLELSRDDSLGMSSTSYEATTYYSLHAVYSSDLPFLITQTILSYLLSGDIELLRMRVDKIVPSEMNITLSTGSPYGNERIKEIVTLFDEYANHTRPLTKLSYKCNYNYASLLEKEIQLELSNGVMETLSIESSSTNEVQRLLEEQLVLPSKPQNNLLLRVRAASRRQEMLRLG